MSQPATTVLEMVDIFKTFPGVKALQAANLAVRPGEVHGLIGENGAGKSTIIKTLAGIYRPDSGHIRVSGTDVEEMTPAIAHAAGIRFVHQELHLVETFTVAESVFLGHETSSWYGLNNREMRRRAEKTLRESLGVELDGRTLIRDLGPAERKLIQIARALVDEGAKVIVFDEPTAPLASVEVGRVLAGIRRLRDAGIGVVYVSHYLGEITDICDRVTVFRNGRDVAVVDPITPDSARQLIKLMVGREVDQLFPEIDRDRPLGAPALELSALGDSRVFQGVDLTVRAGEIVGLAGLLGSGSSDVIDAIVGLRSVQSGAILFDGVARRISSPAKALDHGVVLIPRDRRRDGLVLAESVTANINLAALGDVSSAGLVSAARSRTKAEQLIAKLDIRPPHPQRQARLLSGGNQQKVVLARALAARARIIILDEPTVGVDIGAKAEIYSLIAELAEQGAAVLVSSNDPTEILGMCDRVAVMVRGRIVIDRSTDQLERDEVVALMTGSVAAETTAQEQSA